MVLALNCIKGKALVLLVNQAQEKHLMLAILKLINSEIEILINNININKH